MTQKILLLLLLLLLLKIENVARLFWTLPLLGYLYVILETTLCSLLQVTILQLQDAFWLLTFCLIMLISLGIV